jgi:hypothetical protein
MSNAVRNAMFKLREAMVKGKTHSYINEWDQIIKEADDELIKERSEELKMYMNAVEAVLGTVEREKKRADAALANFPAHEDVIMYHRACAQSHQAGRILSNVRYAFHNAGLPVSKNAGEPKLMKRAFCPGPYGGGNGVPSCSYQLRLDGSDVVCYKCRAEIDKDPDAFK